GAVGQISLATLLASNTTATSMAGPGATASSTLSMDEMLSRPMTIQFDQDSLQFAVQAIADQFNDDLPAGNRLPPVTIVGADLQKMGITQNQQIRGFDQQDVPLRRVLTEIVLAANPDRTASGPDDPKQALIWVVAGQGSDDVEIRITTREAAKDVYELPAEFAFESR
ncbi:MAG: serine/threonine protein kinase, partial [Planctomycetota bacterium]